MRRPQSRTPRLARWTEDLWRTERDEDPTWSTPTVHEAGVDGRAQIIANGYKHIGGYDLLTREEIWRTSGGGDVPVPTPVVSGDLIYLTSAHGRLRPIRAVHVGATGEFGSDPKKSEQLAWIHPRKGIYIQTPIVYEGMLFCCNDGGILGCFGAETGEELFNQRLGSGGSGFSGSAVAADGKLYFTAEDGQVYVIAAIPDGWRSWPSTTWARPASRPPPSRKAGSTSVRAHTWWRWASASQQVTSR